MPSLTALNFFSTDRIALARAVIAHAISPAIIKGPPVNAEAQSVAKPDNHNANAPEAASPRPAATDRAVSNVAAAAASRLIIRSRMRTSRPKTLGLVLGRAGMDRVTADQVVVALDLLLE